MRVLAIVQAWDELDPVRGFTVGWIEALAERVEHVTVLANEQRQGTTRPNISVRSLGRESVGVKLRRDQLLRRWHAQLSSILAKDHPDVIFTHMSPVYSVLASPYALVPRTPIVTWFAHRQLTATVRAAHFLSRRIVTINSASYPINAGKVVSIGHGIDTELYSPGIAPPEQGRPLLLSVARLSPIKDLETFVRALAQLRAIGHDVTGAIVGGELARDRRYADEIRSLIKELGISDSLELVGPVPPRATVDWYRACFAHVNLCPTGALDKAALEAMACGRPSLVANDAYAETLGPWRKALSFNHGSAEDLAFRVDALLAESAATRERMDADLRLSVVARHSLSTLAERLIAVFNDALTGDPRCSALEFSD